MDRIIDGGYSLQSLAVTLAGGDRVLAAEQLGWLTVDLLQEIRAHSYSSQDTDGDTVFTPGPIELNAAIECIRQGALALARLRRDEGTSPAPAESRSTERQNSRALRAAFRRSVDEHAELCGLVARAMERGLDLSPCPRLKEALGRPPAEWHFDSYDCDFADAANWLRHSLGEAG